MTDIEPITLEAELTDDAADRGIETAVKGRHSVARRYVLWVRRRKPEATPAEVVKMLERQYLTAISVAGGLVTAGSIALEVGISLIPGAGAAHAAGKGIARGAAKSATKVVAKNMAKQAALGATKMGAQHVAKMLPAGDEQLQFEITALYALALADIHAMSLDQDQTRALVYGLSNDGVSQGQITAMATDLAQSSKNIATVHGDWSHWAETLAHALPAGAAQELVGGMKTGQLEDVRAGLGAKQQAVVEYGVGAVVGGVTRFRFGREVVDAAQGAFAEAPAEFPPHLEIEIKEESEKDDEPNRAFRALQGAARSTGSWLGDSAQTIGTGAGTVAGAVTRPFRSVDVDGDGIPDEPQALTAVKGVASKFSSPFKRKKNEAASPEDSSEEM